MGLMECRFLVPSSFSVPNMNMCRDIDFEYPANEAEGQGFLDLMTSLRYAFDDLAIANGDTTPYELTASSKYFHVPCLIWPMRLSRSRCQRDLRIMDTIQSRSWIAFLLIGI